MRRRITTMLSVTAVLALVPAGGAMAAPGPGGHHGKSGQHAMQWYLALGDSLAAGFQPGQGDDKTGGYAGPVLADLQQNQGKTKLVNLGCSGETTTSMMDGTKCSYEDGSQLAQAVSFLKAHKNKVRMVTLDLGSNDVLGCVSKETGIDGECVKNALGGIATNLPAILGQLRAASPHTRIVVLNYYDPILAAWLQGDTGKTIAELSVTLLQLINGVIAGAAKGVNASTADVAGAFSTNDWRTTTVPGLGEVPTNVARICEWTWMCTEGNIHPNDTGYGVLADAVEPYTH